MIKTGIFSGSFNPIHIGHLALANYICEYENLDELWFVVSPHNPLKNSVELQNAARRLDDVSKAIEGYSRFRVSDIEFHLPQPSYTINTLEALQSQHPDRDFILIIGADNWNCISLWRNYQTILSNYKIIVYPRKGNEVIIPLPYRPTVRLSDAPIIEISSSFIRNAMANGKDVRFFLPEPLRANYLRKS